MEKADFYTFEFDAPNRINLIIFRDNRVTFSAKIRKKDQSAFLSNNPFKIFKYRLKRPQRAHFP